MKINESIINYYLNDITEAWFNHHQEPPQELKAYYDYVMEMKLGATNKGDLEILKIAFEYLISHPEINCEKYAGSCYPYDHEEIREIIQFAYKTLWPDAGPIDPSKIPEIEFINIPMYDWWELRKS